MESKWPKVHFEYLSPQEYSARSLTRDLPNYAPILQRLEQNPALMRLNHAASGMSGECGEVLEQVKKAIMYGSPIDRQKLLLECGDVLWYMSVMLDALGSSFGHVMYLNDEKLSKRYPQGFNEADAKARRDTK